MCAGALAAPTAALAAFPAGFAPGTLWLSKTGIVGGETVTLFTVVYDGSAAAIEGDVSFTEDGAPLGRTHFSIDPGASAIVSLPWTADAGAHALRASVTNVLDMQTGAPVAIDNGAAGSLAVSVAAPPPPNAAAQYLNSAAAAGAAAFSAAAPAASSTFAAIVSAGETLRQRGIAYLESDLSKNGGGKVLGAATERAARAPGGSVSTADAVGRDGALESSFRVAEAALLYVFESPFLFAIFAVAAGLVALWLLSSIFSRFSRGR